MSSCSSVHPGKRKGGERGQAPSAAEFENLLSQYSQLTDQRGKQLIVRNGYHRE